MYYTSGNISISLLTFKRIKGGRDKTILSTEEEISKFLLKLHVPANFFFCFTTLEVVKVTPDLLL